jgi:hypothetical protein
MDLNLNTGLVILIFLLIVGGIMYAAGWIMDQIPVAPKPRKIVLAVIAVVALLLLLGSKALLRVSLP